MAAITAASHTNGHADSASSGTTASVTLTSGRLYMLAVGTRLSGGTPATPTASGWTAVSGGSAVNNEYRCTVLYKIGDGSTGTHTIDCGGVSQTRIAWAMDQFTDAAVSGTIFGTAGTNTGTGTAVTATLGAFADATNNATFIADFHQWAQAQTVEAGYTKLAENVFAHVIHTSWRLGGDTSPSVTSLGSGDWAAVAVEIYAPAATSSQSPRSMHQYRMRRAA